MGWFLRELLQHRARRLRRGKGRYKITLAHSLTDKSVGQKLLPVPDAAAARTMATLQQTRWSCTWRLLRVLPQAACLWLLVARRHVAEPHLPVQPDDIIDQCSLPAARDLGPRLLLLLHYCWLLLQSDRSGKVLLSSRRATGTEPLRARPCHRRRPRAGRRRASSCRRRPRCHTARGDKQQTGRQHTAQKRVVRGELQWAATECDFSCTQARARRPLSPRHRRRRPACRPSSPRPSWPPQPAAAAHTMAPVSEQHLALQAAHHLCSSNPS